MARFVITENKVCRSSTFPLASPFVTVSYSDCAGCAGENDLIAAGTSLFQSSCVVLRYRGAGSGIAAGPRSSWLRKQLVW
jgi:hypothetical protein